MRPAVAAQGVTSGPHPFTIPAPSTTLHGPPPCSVSKPRSALHGRTLREGSADLRRELPRLRRRRLLRRHDLPPRHPGLHDPGRRHDADMSQKRDSPADQERSDQRPQEPARHAVDGAHQRHPQRHLAVLRQPRRTTSSSTTSPATYGYAVFGSVTDGMDVVDQIAAVEAPAAARAVTRRARSRRSWSASAKRVAAA